MRKNRFLIVDIAWVDGPDGNNRWTRVPNSLDEIKDVASHSGHKYIHKVCQEWKRDIFKHFPQESLNFSNKPPAMGDKVKYAHAATKFPSSFDNSGNGTIFFCSRNKIVGLFNKAHVVPFKDAINKSIIFQIQGKTGKEEIKGEINFTIICPKNEWIRFDKYLEVDKRRHFGDKKRIGQSGLLYIGKRTAKNILKDALGQIYLLQNQNQINILIDCYKKLFPDDKFGEKIKTKKTLLALARKVKEHPRKIPIGLKPYEFKDSKAYKKGLSYATIDLEKKTRANKRHRKLLNLLASKLIGSVRIEPQIGKNNLDLTCIINSQRYIFEVKTNKEGNFRGQLRNAVGQLFEYSWLNFGNQSTKKCIVFENPPPSLRRGVSWIDFIENNLGFFVLWSSKKQRFLGGPKTVKELSLLIE